MEPIILPFYTNFGFLLRTGKGLATAGMDLLDRNEHDVSAYRHRPQRLIFFIAHTYCHVVSQTKEPVKTVSDLYM